LTTVSTTPSATTSPPRLHRLPSHSLHRVPRSPNPPSPRRPQPSEIARAFLTPEPTIAQRIVRAKRTSPTAHPLRGPRGSELAARLSSVLEVIYLIFNEGYSATAGDDLMRPTLCEDASASAACLAELTPTEPEVHGLVALMEIQASRTRARITSTGELVLLFDQNRTNGINS